MKELDRIKETINFYSEDKNNLIDRLVEMMHSSDIERVVSNIGFFLIENFKDEKIEQCIFDLINQPKWKGYNGTFLYILGEYTNDRKYLYFLIDLLMKNLHDGEIRMGACSMIVNIHPPFNKEEIRKSLRRLKQEKRKITDDEDLAMIDELSEFLETQIEIANFYSRFKHSDDL